MHDNLYKTNILYGYGINITDYNIFIYFCLNVEYYTNNKLHDYRTGKMHITSSDWRLCRVFIEMVLRYVSPEVS